MRGHTNFNHMDLLSISYTVVVIFGHLNARTGKINDSLPNEENKHIQDQSEYSLQTKERESFDLTINNHGNV